MLEKMLAGRRNASDEVFYRADEVATYSSGRKLEEYPDEGRDQGH